MNFSELERTHKSYLSSAEIHATLSKTTPALQNALLLSGAVAEEDRELIEVVFSPERFSTWCTLHVDTEDQAAQVWEQTKRVRNLMVAYIINAVTDRIADTKAALHPALRDVFRMLSEASRRPQGEDFPSLAAVLTRARHITITFNHLIDVTLDVVIAELGACPFRRGLLNNLTALVTFGDDWNLIRRPGRITSVKHFIKRGSDSLTLVTFQLLELICRMTGASTLSAEVLRMHGHAYGVAAYFASGDREVLGLVRRYVEVDSPFGKVFDQRYFSLQGNVLKLELDQIREVEQQVRRDLYRFTEQGSLWPRGTPRIITYCPAVSSRGKEQPNALRQLYRCMHGYFLLLATETGPAAPTGDDA